MKQTKLDKLEKLLFEVKALYGENNSKEYLDITLTLGENSLLQVAKDINTKLKTQFILGEVKGINVSNIKSFTSPIGFTVNFKHIN